MKFLTNIILSWRIPSKKNSKTWTWKVLISSKDYREWEEAKLIELKEKIEPYHLNMGLRIEYRFYLPDRRRTDLSNKVESINDLFVKYGLLEDDNWEIIKELKVSWMGVDRENPRCEIDIYSLYE